MERARRARTGRRPRDRARGGTAARSGRHARDDRVAQFVGTGGRRPRLRGGGPRYWRRVAPRDRRDRATDWGRSKYWSSTTASARRTSGWCGSRIPPSLRETMRINLDGPFELARLAVGGMCKRGFGRVVFTSSTAGENPERQRLRRGDGQRLLEAAQGVLERTAPTRTPGPLRKFLTPEATGGSTPHGVRNSGGDQPGHLDHRPGRS